MVGNDIAEINRELVSNACPTFFKARCIEAQRSRHGYYAAGHEMARHFEDLTSAEALENLDEVATLTLHDENSVIKYLRKVLPRCLELVPYRAQNGTFIRGFQDYFDEN